MIKKILAARSLLFRVTGAKLAGRFALLLIAAAQLWQICSPEKLFSQTMPDFSGQASFEPGSRILDYQFDRADRESTPGEWMEEARRGIMTARSVFAETVPGLFPDTDAVAEFWEWSEQELENRFTRWLLERFFGEGKAVASSALLGETGEADKRFLYTTGADGEILYDERTGDPKIIRPGDEAYDFAEDLSSWRETTRGAAAGEVRDYRTAVKEMYPELLGYILPGREEEFERKLEEAGDAAVRSLERELETILAREERYFTAQRLGDVWSLRKKNEDQSAAAIGGRLIEEARETCDSGIAAIEAKIEAAGIDGGDLALAGSEWLEEYRKQFYRGLDAWESAEERFFVRRVEWERSADKAFAGGRETWDAVLSRFEEERQNWEEKSRVLFLEGEQFFARASENLESAISAAKLQYELDAKIRVGAASERTGALANMYVLSGSAAGEARKNIDFWITRYRDLQPGVSVPEGDAALNSWTERELARQRGAGNGLEVIILEELKNWSGLYRSYTAKTEESRGLLMRELSSVTGFSGSSVSGENSYPDPYEAELIQAEADLDYWKNRTAMAEAVASYAAALDAGRSTASESGAAWARARAALDEAALLYGEAEASVKTRSAEIAPARDALTAAAEQMKAVDARLEKLRKNYEALALSFGKQGSLVIAEEISLLRRDLAVEREFLGNAGTDSAWNRFMRHARELESHHADELKKVILKRLIAGDGSGMESLSALAAETENPVTAPDDRLFSFIRTARDAGKISSSRYETLVSAMEGRFHSFNENRLILRQAAISFVSGNGNLSGWYSSVYKNTRGKNFEAPGSGMDARLLGDWEEDRIQLLKARAKLEAEALDFLAGNNAGEAAIILASFYSGDETSIARDRQLLGQIIESLDSLTELRAEINPPGNLQDHLVEICLENEKMLSFIMGNSLVAPQYGKEISHAFLNDYAAKEELSGGLYDSYLGLSELSPAVAAANTERAVGQLGRLWETIGITEVSDPFPQAGAIVRALKDLGEDSASGVSSLTVILDEIFYPLPSSLDVVFNLWKESLNDYRASPDEDNSVLAGRHTNLLNAALLALGDPENLKDGFDFETAAGRYLADPFLEWNDDSIPPLPAPSPGEYEEALAELRERYAKEKYITGEIARLSALAELSSQGSAAAEREMKNAAGEIARAEEDRKKIAEVYGEAANNFRRLGEGYDVLYEKAETAFGNLEEARRAFETQDAVRLWAGTAYLDSRGPLEELAYCEERSVRAQNVLTLLKSVNPDGNQSSEYKDALEKYEDGLSLLGLSLEALNKFDRVIEAEREKNESVYRSYQNRLASFGNNINAAGVSGSALMGMISVSDGFLTFARNSKNEILPSDGAGAKNLNDYFSRNKTIEGEIGNVSSFELALRELSARLASRVTSKEQYMNLAVARDYLVREIIKANPELEEIQSWYKTAEALKADQNLGNMMILKPYKGKVYEQVEQTKQMLEWFQTDTWNSLDTETKRELEFYTILTLMGGGGTNSDYFSRVSEYYQYTIILDLANKSYEAIERDANMILIGWLFKNDLETIRATRDALSISTNELENNISLGYNSLRETLLSLDKRLAAYEDSSARLAGLNKGSNGIIRWDDIEKTLRTSGIPDRDLSSLKELWEEAKNNNGIEARDNREALRLMLDVARSMQDENSRRLSRLWETGDMARAVFEDSYRELHEAYLEGTADFNDLQAAAVSWFAGNVPSAKKHLENTGNILMESFRVFGERGLGGSPEYARLVGEYAGIVNALLKDKSSAELKTRENEWELQRRDIQEKLSRWRESADAIVKEGRKAWKEEGAKLNESFAAWIDAYRTEYGRIHDQWNAAYLEGLNNKEAWAASALVSAGNASSSAALALLGSGAEAGARAMDTTDPLLSMNLPDLAEAGKTLAVLLEKSGTARLASLFDSIRNSPEALAPLVRGGLGGWDVWDSGTVLAEASALAGTLRDDFEKRESTKTAFVVMQTAKDAYNMLEDNVRFANDEFKKNMDDVFIVNGQWRRSGSGYMKDVIVHSTFFNSVITDYAEVDGYRYFVLPRSRLSAYINGNVPMNMNTVQAETLIDSIYSEINDIGKKIFGSGEEDSKGDFAVHTGNEPTFKSEIDIERGREGIFDDPGTGELGRLLSEFYYWMCKENRGITLVSAASWEKPMWDSRGSAIDAPSLRGVVDIALQTGIVIAGAAFTPFTAGTSLLGSAALGAAINSADDLFFSALDVSGGYKSWQEAGVNFGKNLLINTLNSAAGSLFYGAGGAASAFLNSGSGFGGAVSAALTNGFYTMGTGTLSGLLGSVTYSDDEGFGFSADSFTESLRNSGIGALSGMTGILTGGIMDMGLTGFTGDMYSGGRKLSGLAGGLASQGVNYALGNDFVLNLFNAGMFFDKSVNAGLVEMRLGGDGLSFALGSGGADSSIGAVIGAVKGLETLAVNANLLFAGEEDARKYSGLLRTLYSGSDINKDEYENILAGRTRIIETGERETRSVYDPATGIKTIYLGNDTMEDGGRFALNVILSHESYRDGIYSGGLEQDAELAAAIRGHNETVRELYMTYGAGSLGENMLKEALLYDYALNNGYGSLIELIMSGYDNSADYWKLVRDESVGWKWIDDKSADFDISELINDDNYFRHSNSVRQRVMLEMYASGFLDGKSAGIISTGRMTGELASALGQSIMLNDWYTLMSGGGARPMVIGASPMTIGAPGLGDVPLWRAFINDTLDKIAYNAIHTTTVYDDLNRPVTLHNMDTENPDVKELLKQNSGALSHIENMAKGGCNFMDIISIPQILTRRPFGAEEITEIWNQAISKGILEGDGWVKDRNALANLALEKLGITNFGIELAGEKRRNPKFIGYRVEVPYGTGGHFVLTGNDKSLVYNPGNTFTSDQNKWKDILEISIYGR